MIKTNEIMSFCKKPVARAEGNTFMMNTARVHKCDLVAVTEDCCQE